jgi:uncharacterized protein (UPF0335 family)
MGELRMETAATAAAAAEQPAMKFGKEQLKAFIERVERLEEEKKAIADDIRDDTQRPRAAVSTSRRYAP